ncbi:histidinol-phosphatase HisJ family protein [Calderihabitans maritimus]|uniref:Histidinol-phosphatase n=1 Tax=Calderihabitans maritimus TaxID=1246530 RepID=A0A1Z5HUN7_9FIRM|nr:histidinol-phosphatase HisJ family protein [Calderihabitans maritimus]GAW93000.1 histidinol phosphate phosphatase HisJ [Calderihabitans maritimus]
MLVDYHVHGMGHGEGSQTLENLSRYLDFAREQGIEEIGFAEHNWYLDQLDFSVFPRLRKVFPEIEVRVGLEIDFRPETAANLAQKLTSLPFDYLIGSVHEIGDWMFDHPDYKDQYAHWDIDELYETYFQLVARMVDSGLYDIVGHLDLIKVFGYRPRQCIKDLVNSLLHRIAKAGMVVEVNTGGLYKPVGEIYPQETILAECFRLNIPVTLGSDAHRAEDVGRDLMRAKALLRKLGYRKLAAFYRRKIYLIDL